MRVLSDGRVGNCFTALARGVFLSALIAVALHGSMANADIIALDTSGQTGNQDGGYALGEDFTVGSGGIIVTNMGAFDSGQKTLATPLLVSIYYVSGPNFGTQVPGLTTTSITSANSAVLAADSTSDYIFLTTPISPVTLTAGVYRLVAAGFTSSEQNGNVNTGNAFPTSNTGGLISFPFDSTSGGHTSNDWYALNSGMTFPTIPDAPNSNAVNGYLGGTFTFTAVPAPGTLSLLGIGLFCCGCWRRRRRWAVLHR